MTRLVVAILLAASTQASFGDEDLTVLTKDVVGAAPGAQLELYLKKQFHSLVDQRDEKYEQIKSQEDCRRWQQERREFFLQQLGGFPERTPLNAKTVGTLHGDGYRVEKILFESRPNHHVTANLYLPAGEPPYPAVLVPCGHSHEGKAAGAYQRVSILLARHGMAALCYDPIGQGERYQMLDYEHDHTHFTTAPNYAVPHPRVQFMCTIEHTTMGLGCILLGSNIAQYRIWDGMRAIDYLQSRKDILADKIGCTGNSGGGTLTAYLMALDDRIVAAAPSCYLTTFRRLIDGRGAQDAEQNIFAQIAFGMDQADYPIMRAPRPTLICAGTRDVTFPIEGTWEVFRQAKRVYTRLGFTEHVDMIEADAPHGFTLQKREAAVRWMRRWLLGVDDVVREVDVHPDPLTDKDLRELSQGDWTQEDLYCTTEGQVLLNPGEKSAFQLNAEIEKGLRKQRSETWNALTAEQKRARIRETIGCQETSAVAAPEVVAVGRIVRDGYWIEKVMMSPEPGLRLPALVFHPQKPTGEVCLYLHGESMKADAGVGGPIEQLVKQGQLVVAAELRGIGETETGRDKRDYGRGRFGRDVQEIFLAYLIGRSYVGMRVEDVAAWARYAKSLGAGKLHLVGKGEAAIPVLHAAALDPTPYATVSLKRMIQSWSDIVREPETIDQAANVVHGALRIYDLPDLILLAGQNKVSLAEPVDVLGRPTERPPANSF